SLDGVKRLHAATNQRAELFGDEIRIVVHAIGDLQVMLQGGDKRSLLIAEDLLSLFDGYRVGAEGRSNFDTALKRIERGYQPGAFLLHERGTFFIEHRTVLDGIDTSPYCRLNALSTLSMSHDFFASAVRD